MPPVRTQAEYDLQDQRSKLANSYQSLLNEFASPELHTVGNYALGRLIGKGSFGKVYLATHKLTNGSKVVLKSAKKDDANLAREIHHHRQFLHPHIARLYEVIVTENLVWLVLEYCPGDELYNYLLEHGRMEAEKVQKVFTQLVGAVSYVHGKSCVHRDLKLENILLDKHGSVKLVDFGFTREYQGSTSYLQTWCGTVCYSAPEMLKGEKYAGEKVDVWSLGIILYALLCGELPYDEDDETTTKGLILKEEPNYPDYMPEGAKTLIKKLLSKRPLLRPSLGDILKDPWLSDHAPQQQEILKLQQRPAFSTHTEKETLERMKAAGVDIDMVIENVLSQRCDALAGWWALLIEKEQRKEKRRERKRKERDAEARSLRRLSTASSRLLAQSALGEISEGQEGFLLESPKTRGRRMTRPSGNATLAPELPRVTEGKSPSAPSPTGSEVKSKIETKDFSRGHSRSRSRPIPPPKDPNVTTPIRRPRNPSRGSTSLLRYSTVNSDLLSPPYMVTPQRKRRFYGTPLKEQLAVVKTWFKDNAKRTKSPQDKEKNASSTSLKFTLNGKSVSHDGPNSRDLRRSSTGPLVQARKGSPSGWDTQGGRATMPLRPRLNTTSSRGSGSSLVGKRTSLSPHTLTPHSYRRTSAGLRGRKSTSSSVSSVRSTFKGHRHTHSKASSTSSASIASPSGMSSASGSRMARSPHSSVKVLPSTPTTNSFPSGIRVSRHPPSGLTPVPTFGGSDAANNMFAIAPSSPSLPVFARRKRSVFKGPMNGSPSGFGRASLAAPTLDAGKGRRSSEMIRGIVEEEDELDEVDEEDEMEDVDHFGPALTTPGDESAVVTPGEDISPSRGEDEFHDASPGAVDDGGKSGGGTKMKGVPLTAQALAMMQKETDAQAAKEKEKEDEEGM